MVLEKLKDPDVAGAWLEELGMRPDWSTESTLQGLVSWQHIWILLS